MADLWVYGMMAASLPLMFLHGWAEDQCTKLDVATGRRDPGAIRDDYGSNRGWHWRWKIVSVPAALLAAPGMVLWGAAFIDLMAR